MKKIGIITMHRVLNYGSILQAYALQKKLSDIGVDSEIIDYIYPNAEHKKRLIFIDRIKKLICFFLGLPTLYLRKKKKHKFDLFFKKYIKLSPKTYSTSSELLNHSPEYDLYLTGSDQVWNPIHTKNDTTFLCSFVKDDSPRCSYAASFSTSILPDELRGVYSNELLKYKLISVRESSGIDVVKNLTGRAATHVCDPTLLLSRAEWGKIVVNSELKIEGKYILVYVLSYAYNPYPYVDRIIEEIRSKLKLNVVYLNGRKADYFNRDATIIKDAGPLDFLKLFLNASFVITTSFHGTCFALNFGIPFYSVIEGNEKKDSRIIDLLKRVGAEDRAINYKCDIATLKCDTQFNTKMSVFIEESLSFLKDVAQI